MEEKEKGGRKREGRRKKRRKVKERERMEEGQRVSGSEMEENVRWSVVDGRECGRGGVKEGINKGSKNR